MENSFITSFLQDTKSTSADLTVATIPCKLLSGYINKGLRTTGLWIWSSIISIAVALGRGSLHSQYEQEE